MKVLYMYAKEKIADDFIYSKVLDPYRPDFLGFSFFYIAIAQLIKEI